ncbi:unnamed protein product [Lactuca saligna]|uniref:Uncharacterized protein n=1 Tax=Lactuca saligna TaxID=75948 RepID=A0AA35ZEH0_LACSI|nr:unnamed protein product [Lactuca saligna]
MLIWVKRCTVETTTTTTLKTSTITTTVETTIVAPPQPASPPPTLVTPPSSTTTFSLTFAGVMQEPIASLFSSQLTESEKTINKAKVDDDNVMILNSKMNYILQFLADTGGKNSLNGVEVKYLLKYQDSLLRKIIESVDKKHEERMDNQSCILDYEINKLREFAKVRHELFVQQLFKSKSSLELQDNKVFEKVEEFLSDFKETLSEVDLSTQSSIFEDSIFAMVSNIESSMKAELALILNLVLRLPTNAPHPMYVSQGVDRGVGVGSPKGSGEDSRVVVGKVMPA